jgi:hypothetical protein
MVGMALDTGMYRGVCVPDSRDDEDAISRHVTGLVLNDAAMPGPEAVRPVTADRRHDSAPPPIPGERDPTTLTTREPGAIGGRFNGADLPPLREDQTLDEAERQDRRLEAGGKRR